MAAPVRRAARSWRGRLAVAGATAFAVLLLPASAQAHTTSVVSSLDFVARVVSTGRDPSAVRARVDDGDRKLELRVARSHTVVVLGYAGEAFLRFSPAGVEVNDRSPTAVADKLGRDTSVPALTSNASPRWSQLTTSDRFAWHDHRLGPVPGRSYGEGAVGTWAIPLVVDGRPDRIVGRLWHGRGPPLWIWLALFGVALAAAVVLIRQRSDRAASAALASAGIAGAAAELLSIGLSFGPGVPSSTAWESVPASIVVVGAAVAVFVRLPQARGALAGLVGLVAALVGLGDAGVLVHGYVISSLPAAVIRAAAATAVSAGLVAAVTVAARHLAGSSAPPRRARPARLSVPRGRSR